MTIKILFHKAPEGYEYWSDDFNRSYKRVWIRNLKFDFIHNDGKPADSVHCFIHKKTGQIHAPINSKKPGKSVDIKDTTPFSAMQLNLNPLEKALFQ